MATDDAHRGGVWMVRDPHHSLAETISIGSSSCLGRLPDESLQATRPAIPVRLGAKVRPYPPATRRQVMVSGGTRLAALRLTAEWLLIG